MISISFGCQQNAQTLLTTLLALKELPMYDGFLTTFSLMSSSPWDSCLCEYICIFDNKYSYSNYSIDYNKCFITENNYTSLEPQYVWPFRVAVYELQLTTMRIFNNIAGGFSNYSRMLIGNASNTNTVNCYNPIRVISREKFMIFSQMHDTYLQQSSIYQEQWIRYRATLVESISYLQREVDSQLSNKVNINIVLTVIGGVLTIVCIVLKGCFEKLFAKCVCCESKNRNTSNNVEIEKEKLLPKDKNKIYDESY